MRYSLRFLPGALPVLLFLLSLGCGEERITTGPPEVWDPPNEPAPTCEDGRRNGEESHVDCGGPDCPPCANGLGCSEADDCASGVCGSGFCLIPTCSDGVANGDEIDVDCGGGCGLCSGGQACSGDADCLSSVCDVETMTCLPTSCMDGIQNAGESDIDCGGPCSGCSAGATCIDPGDCRSFNCAEGACVEATCQDGVRNQDETDVDCGGTVCAQRCDDTLACEDDGDCANDVCAFNTCISCQDGFQNGEETDRDCGGPDCGPCPGGLGCRDDADCLTGACEDFVCISCQDGVQNGIETDVDCGGGDPTAMPPEEGLCARCLDGRSCMENTDCLSGNCTDGRCIGCGDGRKNGFETDIDCGDDREPGERPEIDACPGCPDRFTCLDDSDCENDRCEAGICISCEDLILDGDETDVDCGGPDCGPCAGGRSCIEDADCASLICTDSVCEFPNCGDGIRNGLETDVDCGGPACEPCGDGDVCSVASDCTSGVCGGDDTCQAPTCTDGVVNGLETDVDCGGMTACPRCADGEICGTAADCLADSCTFQLCGDDPCTPIDPPSTTTFYDVCDFNTPSLDVIPDISGSDDATEVTLTDDGNVRIDLPFTFRFFGAAYSDAFIHANGVVSFGADGTPRNASNASLPTDTDPDVMLVAYWDALDPTEEVDGVVSGVWYETRGTTPNRRFIIQYRVQHETVTTPTAESLLEFRIALDETTDEINVHYVDTNVGVGSLNAGRSATAGVNEFDGLAAHEYSFGTASLPSGQVVRYTALEPEPPDPDPGSDPEPDPTPDPPPGR